ncbi:condensation domain-containing protein [Streptomyces sp. NPDC088190]|uniref:condensation domain-containing protein n=1 Tax=unclassified Streptomyces TaxID=2593676 RepID=UPI002E780F86|nr:condensation domain-containing protein [Streptomyces sp. JV190]MEE1838779.1 condensation domain-containing protein [Streptomyces sp. JV190]
MTPSKVKPSRGPTSLAEEARLAGEFDDWHNLTQLVVWLTGELDTAALRNAWWQLCRRHDVLRRTYVSADEACTYHDVLSDVEFHNAETDETAIELMRRFLGTPFRLDGPGFSRIAIVQLSGQRHLLGIAMDHIITDVVSWKRIHADLAEFYDRALAGDDADGMPNPSSYQSFASEQRRLFSGTWGEERRAFWRSYVGEFGTCSPPFSVGAEHTGEYRSRVLTRDLPVDAKTQLQTISRQARVTPFAMVSAGVLAGAREVTNDPMAGISVAHHGRMLPGTSQTAGLFVQTMPLHLGRQATSPFETAQDVFRRTHDVFEYALPLSVAAKSWNETLHVADQAAGLHVALNEQPPPTRTVRLFGTEAKYIALTFPREKRWPETVVVSWNLYDMDPQLVAQYNANYFADAAVEELLDAAEGFVFPAGS